MRRPSSHVLIVDDDATLARGLARALRREGHVTHVARGPGQAFDVLCRLPLDLIVSDAHMPAMRGAALLEAVREFAPGIGRVLMTADAGLATASDALRGADVDRLLLKPFAHDALREAVDHARGRRPADAPCGAGLAAAHALVRALDAKDRQTAAHSRRVGRFAGALARELGLHARGVLRAHLAGALHDVGKIGLPDAILRKAGPLDATEFERVRQHPEFGADLVGALPRLGDLVPAIRHHHERYDGQGYPRGLAGLAIPQLSRIIAAADTAEAMTSHRPYRRALPWTHVAAELRGEAGGQFDPAVAGALLRLIQRAGLARRPTETRRAA